MTASSALRYRWSTVPERSTPSKEIVEAELVDPGPPTIDSILDDAESALDDIPEPSPEPLTRDDIEIEILPPGSLDVPRDDGYQEPWARLPEETDRSFELFSHFRDSGPSRSITATAKEFGISATTVSNKHSSPNRWRDRARAFDDYQDRVYRLQYEQAIRDMADRHAGLMERGLIALAAPLEALYKRLQSDPELIDELSETSVKRLLDLANRSAKVMPAMMGAERLARGLPSSIQRVEGTVEHDHIHRADREQLADIASALASAGAFDERGGVGELGTADDAADHQVHDEQANAETDGVDADERNA